MKVHNDPWKGLLVMLKLSQEISLQDFMNLDENNLKSGWASNESIILPDEILD